MNLYRRMSHPIWVSAGLQHSSMRGQLWLVRVPASLWSIAQISDVQAFAFGKVKITLLFLSDTCMFLKFIFLFLFFLPLKVLGNTDWPRYLSSYSGWLHILFAWLFLWRIFTKVSTTFLILFLLIRQRHSSFGWLVGFFPSNVRKGEVQQEQT